MVASKCAGNRSMKKNAPGAVIGPIRKLDLQEVKSLPTPEHVSRTRERRNREQIGDSAIFVAAVFDGVDCGSAQANRQSNHRNVIDVFATQSNRAVRSPYEEISIRGEEQMPGHLCCEWTSSEIGEWIEFRNKMLPCYGGENFGRCTSVAGDSHHLSRNPTDKTNGCALIIEVIARHP